MTPAQAEKIADAIVEEFGAEPEWLLLEDFGETMKRLHVVILRHLKEEN